MWWLLGMVGFTAFWALTMFCSLTVSRRADEDETRLWKEFGNGSH